MTTQEQVDNYINSLPQAKRSYVQELQALMRNILPDGQLWYDDGKDAQGKTVSNPSVGYGSYTMQYANGKTRDYYQTGMSANTSGISVYIMGIDDRTYLPQNYGDKIGKATVTGYCIKFKKLEDIDTSVLEAAIRHGLSCTSDR